MLIGILIGLIIVLLLAVAVYLFIRNEKMGSTPTKQDCRQFESFPYYKGGKFENINHTPMLAKGHSYWGVLKEQIFNKAPDRIPNQAIPSVKTDLHDIPLQKDVLVWFGHSSYYIQLGGKRFLIDPVFSGNASPIPGTVTAFKGADDYSAEDMPEIDYLLITHDHYDHLDYPTIKVLKPKVKRIVCGLGVSCHFKRWGYDAAIIQELGWYDGSELAHGLKISAEPARHFSGRGTSRNNTLWQSYVLQSTAKKLYLGGDSGYDEHFAAIGQKHGPFDLVLLDCGQYNDAWRNIHMHPDEVIQAADDLKAKHLFPLHNSKFRLANHSWYEPLNRVSAYHKGYNFGLVTPKIGELLDLNELNRPFEEWWE